ncbi:DUF6895 family protein [Bradyrhizobium sp. CB1015]|uniref:DUF6895 family protein n=1 Tax=Bradyrhizobium sp. CB1015 TaxID=2976822 RepID=UPI0021AA8E1C|nr:hypothetical protein [Bradyrhizobium sp. CB1015]UWU94300.1 hypothetical protein N2604_10845 [Bradyrhizobium sp. CB1015]
MIDPSDDSPFFRLVLDGLNGAVTGAAARDKFLCESAIMARAAHVLGSKQDSRLDAVIALLEKQLNSSHQISLADNSLRIAELLYPYAALSNYIGRIQFYEIWLDEFARVRQFIPDRPKFLDCEDQFILYMAGRSKLPALVSDSWHSFYKRAYDFNVEQCYVLTHRYMYSTDFGQHALAVSWIAPALLIIAGKSALWGNFDLFFESAFCALSANLDPHEVLLIDSLSRMFMPQLKSMLKQDDVQSVYHELFVYSLFKMQRDRVFLSGTTSNASRGKLLTNFVASLASKSPDKIVQGLRAIQSVCPRTFYNEVCIEKLSWLSATAGMKTLFEKEIRSAGRELEPGVYDEYRRLVNVEFEKLRSLPAPEPLMHR